jgi:hypothetical protein
LGRNGRAAERCTLIKVDPNRESDDVPFGPCMRGPLRRRWAR